MLVVFDLSPINCVRSSEDPKVLNPESLNLIPTVSYANPYSVKDYANCKLRFKDQCEAVNAQMTLGLNELSDAYSQKVAKGLPKSKLG